MVNSPPPLPPIEPFFELFSFPLSSQLIVSYSFCSSSTSISNPTSETISLLVSLGCITLMSALFGRKTAGTKMSNINYARGLVIALYLVSWVFSFMATQLVQTNDYNIVSCTISIYTCIALYAGSKFIIYLFLMEKVYVVTAVGLPRSEFYVGLAFFGLSD